MAEAPVVLAGGRVTLYRGDCLDVLRALPDGSVDAVVTDPPYGMNNDNNYTRFTTGPRGHGSASSRAYPPTTNDDRPFDPSLWLQFDQVILWGANHFAARLPVGTTLVWVKRHEHAYGSFLSDAEIGWMKGGHGVYLHKDLSNNSRPERRVHPNQKPIGLMRWCIRKPRLAPGSLVFDPYMGSGTTALACFAEGMRFIGCEISPDYFQVAHRRIEQAALESVP